MANDSSPPARAHFLFCASANQARSLRSRALRECARACAMFFGRQRQVFLTVSFFAAPVTFCREMSTPQNSSSSSNSSSPNTVYTKFEVPPLKDLEMFDQFLTSNHHPHQHLCTPSGMPLPFPNDYVSREAPTLSYFVNTAPAACCCSLGFVHWRTSEARRLLNQFRTKSMMKF